MLLLLLLLLVVAVAVLQRLDVEEEFLHVLLHLVVLVVESRHLLPQSRVLALEERGTQRDLPERKDASFAWAIYMSNLNKIAPHCDTI